jgi:effector-binding domain-containing protein
VPIAGDPKPSGRAEWLEIPAADVAVLVHEGSFADADRTYGALGTVVAARGIDGGGPVREHYVADDRIEVCWPVTVGRA